MTDTPTAPAIKPEFGAGNIVGESIQLLFKHFPIMFGIVFVPVLIYNLIATGFAEDMVNATSFADIVPVYVLSAISGLMFIVLQAIIIRIVISLKTGGGIQLNAALSAALSGFFPILILGIVASIAMGIGFLLFFVPGLYVMAMLSVYVPAIVFERAGFNALGRSTELTKDYRWAIVFMLILVVIVGWIAQAILGGIITLLWAGGLGGAGRAFTDPAYALNMPLWATVAGSAVEAAIYPFSMIATGLAYARLREIKEGGSTQDLLKVFE